MQLFLSTGLKQEVMLLALLLRRMDRNYLKIDPDSQHDVDNKDRSKIVDIPYNFGADVKRLCN